jgi:type 1 glutamine amidotransferase
MTTHRFPFRKFLTPAGVALGVLTLTLLALPSRRLPAADEAKDSGRPLRGMIIAGGCCHDYERQKVLLSEEISKRARVEWTIVHEKTEAKNHRVSVYEKPDWAKGYDVIVHNECFSGVTDLVFIENVLAAHRNGTAAVVIHCAMHTFRDLKTDQWREFLGVTSPRHGKQQPLEVKNVKPHDPIMRDFPLAWKTGNEELYFIDKVWPDTEALAQAHSVDTNKDYPVIWKHTYGKGRVFGTTLTHHNHHMADPVYLDMITRGFLWACDQLESDGRPTPAYRVKGASAGGQ